MYACKKIPRDPFAKIPSPVLLFILKLVHDLLSLRNLDKASPTVASLFDEWGPEIIEDVVSASLPGQVQTPIRIVIIRSRTIPVYYYLCPT